MITILSIESDQSTNQVIDWLAYYNAAWKRINAEDFEEKSLVIDSRNWNDRNSIPNKIINRIIDMKNNDWFLLRQNQKPCKDCVCNLLCPPISVYEKELNRYNLCAIIN